MFIKAGRDIYNIDNCNKLEFRRSDCHVRVEDWELIETLYINNEYAINIVLAELHAEIYEFRPQWCDLDLMYRGKVSLNKDKSKFVEDAGNYRKELWSFFEEELSLMESKLINYVWDCITNGINVDLTDYKCIVEGDNND